MRTYFFDSSALAKRYHPEIGSAQVMSIFREPDCRIIISLLTVVEMRSMFAGKVRMGVLTPVQANELAEHFKADVATQQLEVFVISDFNYRHAESLLARYGFAHRLRSLDALQLAVALDLRDQAIDHTMVAADQTLCDVAILERLLVLNPND